MMIEQVSRFLRAFRVESGSLGVREWSGYPRHCWHWILYHSQEDHVELLALHHHLRWSRPSILGLLGILRGQEAVANHRLHSGTIGINCCAPWSIDTMCS